METHCFTTSLLGIGKDVEGAQKYIMLIIVQY